MLTIAQVSQTTTLNDPNPTELSDFALSDFELGDVIFDYPCTLSNPETISVPNEQNIPDFYLIYQGRVRLLGRSQAPQSGQLQDVSVLLLEANETFGADRLFNQTPLPYRAVAASPVQVARIPATDLLPLLEQFPQLKAYLLIQTLQRERLIFLKSLTALRSLPGHHLRHLRSHLLEETLVAGTDLAVATPASTGRFWLRAGEIQSRSTSRVPAVGDSWGHPDIVPDDWVATTELRIYH
ncbi:cyclic nucleotide-binding domain-containing protein [bacterium]|nr:cyclic nucleotide-binding domain-containing protein [bacterium]